MSPRDAASALAPPGSSRRASRCAAHRASKTLFRELIEDMATRALILDEATGVRTLFSRILRSLDCVTVEALDGGEAMDALEHGEFDLAILDINASMLSGIDLLQAVRTSERYASMPVVLITDGADQSTVTEIVKLGASDCLTKPFE